MYSEMGSYPVFYAAIGEGVAISTSIAELLKRGANRQLDDPAIAAFLRLGFFIGEDTPFAAVRAFPAGGRLSWQAGSGLSIEGALIPHKLDESISHTAAVDEYVERFRHAIEHSLPASFERCALPLSGGRDSRHIAVELHRLGIRPGLILSQTHFKSRNNEDIRVAKNLSDAFGWKLTVVPQSSDPVYSELQKNKIFDCLTDEHAWLLPASRALSKFGATTAYDGLAGDTLSAGLWLRPKWLELQEAGKHVEMLTFLPNSGYGAKEIAHKSLLRTAYQARWSSEVALDRIMKEYSRHLHSEQPIVDFIFWNRTRREIAPFLLRLSNCDQVITPYLADSVFDFLWNLPVRHQRSHDFHDKAIAAASPHFKNIPYESTKHVDADGEHHARIVLRNMATKPIFWRDSNFVNTAWIRPRLARGLIDRNYSATTGYWTNWAIWLTSLNKMINP